MKELVQMGKLALCTMFIMKSPSVSIFVRRYKEHYTSFVSLCKGLYKAAGHDTLSHLGRKDYLLKWFNWHFAANQIDGDYFQGEGFLFLLTVFLQAALPSTDQQGQVHQEHFLFEQ